MSLQSPELKRVVVVVVVAAAAAAVAVVAEVSSLGLVVFESKGRCIHGVYFLPGQS